MSTTTITKLVRDYIPKEIANTGKKVIFSVTRSAEEYEKFLKQKLIEEASEVVHTDNRDDIVEELADVLTVVEAFQRIYSITDGELASVKREKIVNKGHFTCGYILESVED
jgi:predicted house-cleaning noncanonical NTP pyrophosphatase (MazG superfamily)